MRFKAVFLDRDGVLNAVPGLGWSPRRPEELVLGKEVSELARHRRGQVHQLIGSRERAGIDERTLRRLVPDLHRRDVFVCGPEGFVTSIVYLAASLGVPDEAIHHEAYAL